MNLYRFTTVEEKYKRLHPDFHPHLENEEGKELLEWAMRNYQHDNLLQRVLGLMRKDSWERVKKKTTLTANDIIYFLRVLKEERDRVVKTPIPLGTLQTRLDYALLLAQPEEFLRRLEYGIRALKEGIKPRGTTKETKKLIEKIKKLQQERPRDHFLTTLRRALLEFENINKIYPHIKLEHIDAFLERYPEINPRVKVPIAVYNARKRGREIRTLETDLNSFLYQISRRSPSHAHLSQLAELVKHVDFIGRYLKEEGESPKEIEIDAPPYIVKEFNKLYLYPPENWYYLKEKLGIGDEDMINIPPDRIVRLLRDRKLAEKRLKLLERMGVTLDRTREYPEAAKEFLMLLGLSEETLEEGLRKIISLGIPREKLIRARLLNIHNAISRPGLLEKNYHLIKGLVGEENLKNVEPDLLFKALSSFHMVAKRSLRLLREDIGLSEEQFRSVDPNLLLRVLLKPKRLKMSYNFLRRTGLMGDELREKPDKLLQLLSMDPKELNEELKSVLGVDRLRFKGERNYNVQDLIQRFQKDRKG